MWLISRGACPGQLASTAVLDQVFDKLALLSYFDGFSIICALAILLKPKSNEDPYKVCAQSRIEPVSFPKGFGLVLHTFELSRRIHPKKTSLADFPRRCGAQGPSFSNDVGDCVGALMLRKGATSP